MLVAIFRAVWGRKLLLGLHIVVNAGLLALAWYWLSIPEATVSQLLASALVAVIVVFGALWLHGTTLAAFRKGHSWPPFLITLKRVPALFVWVALVSAIAWLSLRFIPKPFGGAVAAIGCLLLLPLASQMASDGFRAVARAGAWRPLVDPRFYLVVPVLFALGVWAPYKLVWWIPKMDGLTAQTMSMALRFSAAYLIAVTAWFLVAAAIGRLSMRRI